MKKEVFILDTNIWISYLLSKKYDHLVKIILENNLKVVTCQNLIAEITQVLQRDKFKKYISGNEIAEAVKIHLKLCKLVQVKLKSNNLTDKKDNYLIDFYREAKATALVTGDKLLSEEAFKLGLNVISLAQFKNMMD
jgi:hypothetical protein